MTKNAGNTPRLILTRRLALPDGTVSSGPVLLTLDGNRLLASQPYKAETPATTYFPGTARLRPGGIVVFENQK